ncbi:uncharacterized protein LOC130613271 [Hydractinia symbiolongicarpus]|uniref:uncharacterized protein LOC130613271 n=1 Tax=Hydractinia symbiolongicarpus TaxID=13093 RepID=UPI00254D2299|nr:uncharacterized protein LOC130613271 [Hydractinia symbiolongicarpus]XP_057290596.1 uncharacterized protein LOC130613271 [Hydractinia symbiolongicarpus]XP_057290597.1 uncharacterized protein LOC130613271 [Hydractinia symbiolongicarpus]
MTTTDKEKADFFLFGVIGAFIFFTFIAFLFNEGRHLCVLPLLKKLFPNRKFKTENDDDDETSSDDNVSRSSRGIHGNRTSVISFGKQDNFTLSFSGVATAAV